jgi:maltoporin
MRLTHRLPILVATASWFLTPTDASCADPELEQLKADLQKQIATQVDAIKAQYEARVQTLEKRIGTLEADNARLKKQAPGTSTPASSREIALLNRRITELEVGGSKPSPEAIATVERSKANAQAIEAIEAKLQAGATETRDRYRDEDDWPFDATKLYDLPRPFEFHGYLRSGFGMNGEGGKMEAFKAPGAGAKYRLGNESDTYGEIGLTNNWLRLDDPLKDPYVRSTVMVSYSSGENFSYDSLNNLDQGNDIALRQAYVEGGNVIKSAPDIRFWGGQRYYRRHDIHINDFYYLDMSGYGAGVEEVPLGSFAKLALAWIGGSVDNYITDNGRVAKQNIDLRLYDIAMPFGKGTFWFNYANSKGGEVRNVFNADGSNFDIDSSSGWAAGFIHRTGEEQFLGGYNEFTVQYGQGAAYNFASTLDSSGPHLDDASRFRVTDHFTIQPSQNFAMQAVGIYEDTDYGGPNSRERWVSFGVRPVYFFNDRFSIALEAGVDWVKSDPLGTDGHLWKVTLAPQLSRGQKFFSRPQLRGFITYARWSEDFRGRIGGTACENATEGLSYGVQVEAWW